MTEQNWHPADIIAALRKRGTSLAKISREAGLASSTLSNALTRPWPKGEWLIAKALDVSPAAIWPGRYVNGKRKPRKPLSDSSTKTSGKSETGE
ncbi:helix-turn-helix transcriptional regulator [Kosakonia sp. MUSA4]|uniref:helix-turn-helix domain-containing protein n=1 Tax=Kosakonia sp. MUSA4 TaxID=2067958 RepID=UPI00159A65CE|nr:helix-turn-helix transcriptional regulator [Kosakonia sp. MUSA4]QJT79292.1 transcriptional regulator [Kosakonia sp. MUSA4]